MDARFATCLGLEATADAIASSMSSLGYSVSRSSTNNRIRLRAATQSPWHRVLLRFEPQRFEWIIRRHEGGAQLEYSARYATWYAAVLLILATASLALWGAAVHWMSVVKLQSMTSAVLVAAVIVASGSLVAAVAAGILADASNMKARVLRAMDEAFRLESGELTRVDSQSVSRHGRLATMYVAAVAVVAVIAFMAGYATQPRTEVEILGRFGVLYIASLIGFGCAMGNLVIVSLRHPGMGERSSLMMPALNTVFGLVPISVALLLLELFGRTDNVAWRRASEAGFSWFLWLIFFVLMGMSCHFIVKGFRTAAEATLIERDVKTDAGASHARQASDPSAYMGSLRIALLAIAASTVAIIALPLLAAINFAPRTGAYVVATWMVADLIGAPYDSAIAAIGGFVFLCATVAPIVALEAVSVGQYFHQLHRFRRLALRSREDDSTARELQLIVNELASMTGMRPPRVVLVPGESCSAAADVIGFKDRSRIIVVGPEIMEQLTLSEKRALLAHELAHHLNGDCLRHRALRLVTRLALLGDGYAAVLEHSYAYEERADRTAVARFGIPPRDLIACLRKLDAVLTIDAMFGESGLPLHARRSAGQTDSAGANRTSTPQMVRIWWSCYTCGVAMGYWHPTVRDRIAALRSM